MCGLPRGRLKVRGNQQIGSPSTGQPTTWLGPELGATELGVTELGVTELAEAVFGTRPIPAQVDPAT